MKNTLLFALLALLLVGCERPEYDTIIENGTIVDGSGKDRFVGDIGVRDGVIASVGDLSGSTATNRVDASNMIVAPGFIDIHSHATSGSFW